MTDLLNVFLLFIYKSKKSYLNMEKEANVCIDQVVCLCLQTVYMNAQYTMANR